MPALKNPRHEAFCQAYAKGEHAGNARACYRAVYNKDDRAAASRVQHRRDVSQRVVEIRDEIAAIEAAAMRKTIEAVGVPWIVERLIENVNRAMTAVPVLDEDGKPIGEFKYDGAVANKALELLGKHHGMFVEARELTVTHRIGDMLDLPPRETFKQWEERRRLELAAPIEHTNGHGNGKSH